MMDLVSIDHRLLDILLCQKAFEALKSSLAIKGMTIYSAVVALHRKTSPEDLIANILDCMRDAERMLA